MSDAAVNINSQKIGERLRESRQACKMSQADVAKELKVSRQAVSGWERGSLPTVVQLREVGLLYGVSADYILYGVKTIPASRFAVIGEIFAKHETPAGQESKPKP